MNTNFDRFLPVGTVVLLSGGKKRIMITGYVAVGKETGDRVYDYIGCLYPEGVISSDKNLLFDHNQIEKVYYMGYSDDEQKNFSEKLKQLIENEINLGKNNENVVQSKNEVGVQEQINQPLNDNVQSSAITFDDNSVVNNTFQQETQRKEESNNALENLNDPVKNDIFNSVPSSTTE